MLFKGDIHDWPSWGRVYQSIPLFTPVIEEIYRKEGLDYSPPTNLTPGTNAVFRCKNTVIKIFAPKESGLDGARDMETELFACSRAFSLGAGTPNVLASGCLVDKYAFSYMVTDFVMGTDFAKSLLSKEEKLSLGRRLRDITDAFNTPCRDFNGVDVIWDEDRQMRWEPFPKSFKEERLEYLKSKSWDKRVFVHGDINGNNLIIDHEGGLHLIDFADAVLAPICYEHALIAAELFQFDPGLMEGYFHREGHEQILNLCMDGLLIHDFGGDVIRSRICPAEKIHSLKILREILKKKMEFTV